MGVFGVADYEPGVRIAKFKMEDCNCYETWYTGIFGIADCNSDIRFVISDLKNPHTLSFIAIAKNFEFTLI